MVWMTSVINMTYMIYVYGRYMTCTCDVYSLVYMIFI